MINFAIHSQTTLCQLQNTVDVIFWFKKLHNKNKCKFRRFDIVEFYPLIINKKPAVQSNKLCQK